MGKIKRISPAPGGGKVTKPKAGMSAGQVSSSPNGVMANRVKPQNIGMISPSKGKR